MDVFARILVRAAMWLRRPPSRRHVRILVIVLAGALAIVAIEHWVGWPEWAEVERGGFIRTRP